MNQLHQGQAFVENCLLIYIDSPHIFCNQQKQYEHNFPGAQNHFRAVSTINVKNPSVAFTKSGLAATLKPNICVMINN